jgi:hypothetical protein
VTRMLNLLGPRSVKAGRIFDIFLAATILDNGVQRIYTGMSVISKESPELMPSILSRINLKTATGSA